MNCETHRKRNAVMLASLVAAAMILGMSLGACGTGAGKCVTNEDCGNTTGEVLPGSKYCNNGQCITYSFLPQ
jgi:hypothetical protein